MFFHRSFRLFLHTKLSNPHYPPEVQAETTLINFTVTEQVRTGHHGMLLLCRGSATLLTSWHTRGCHTCVPAPIAATRAPLRLVICNAAPRTTRAVRCRPPPPTLQGLEDQLLALVVNKERPDLEETKTQLIIQVG